MDTAHKQTDKILSINERAVKQAYAKAFNDIKAKFTELYSNIDLTAEDGNTRLIEAQKYSRIDKIADFVTEAIAEVNKKQVTKINSISGDVYKTNFDGMIQELKELGIDESKITKVEAKKEAKKNENPYNEITIDNLKDKTQIRGAVKGSLLTSIFMGSTVAGALNGIKSVFEKNLASELRMLTLNVTSLENQAILDILIDLAHKLRPLGYDVIKKWETRGDEKVRDAHARADGQEASADKPFYVGGEELMKPGDPQGSPSNTINCRCKIRFSRIVKI